MYNDDFYNKPSDFDLAEYIEEIERLRKENESYRELCDNWEEKVKELHDKINEAEKAACDAKQMSLKELLADCPTVAYCIVYKFVKKPKCNLCNERRYVELFSSTGRKHEIRCNCDTFRKVYRVKEIPLVEISKSYGDEMKSLYLIHDNEDSEERDLCVFGNCFADDVPFENNDPYREVLVFRSKARAEEYAAWLQTKEDTVQ